MTTISYTEIRKNFKESLKKICIDHAPVTVTRKDGEAVVIMSLKDYAAIEETLHLLRSPVNAARLSKAVSDLKAGINFRERELIEE